jgi:predicted DNA-binding transcriptional regulator YafY
MEWEGGGVRSSRLVALLLHLQDRRGATAGELATLLEVSVRTIYRDVAALQAAGVPLWTETGPGGGIRLLEGWRSRLDGLTADEAGTLFLAGVPGAAADLGLGALLAAAQVKVLATLPPELRARAGRVRERLHVDAPGWFHAEEDVPHLATVAEGVWEQRRLDVRYGRGGAGREPAARRLDPLGLVLKGGTWYLVARHRHQVRTYRAGRIVAATLLAGRFTRPDGFDLAAWWAQASAEFDRHLLRATVRVRLPPGARRRLPQVVGRAAADAAVEVAPPDDDGWQALDLPVESEEVAQHQLTALGADVEVLAPASLRAAMAAQALAVARRHGAEPRSAATT